MPSLVLLFINIRRAKHFHCTLQPAVCLPHVVFAFTPGKLSTTSQLGLLTRVLCFSSTDPAQSIKRVFMSIFSTAQVREISCAAWM